MTTIDRSPPDCSLTRGSTVSRSAAGAFLALLLVSAFPGSVLAADSGWSLLLEPMYMDGYGNDQHILTIHEFDFDSTPALDASTPVTLDTEQKPGYRFELQYTRAQWSDWTFGLDFFWFATSQGRAGRANAADAPIDQVVFQAADRSFTSDGPGEVLFFRVLEDTDMAAWTADLYGLRTLAESSDSNLKVQFGLRNADFDNDVHTVAGIEDVEGALTDASSNYGRMIGPLIGLSAETQVGDGMLRGYLGQSIVFGSTDLTGTVQDFIGPANAAPSVTGVDLFRADRDVAIPITEFRINWLYPVTPSISVGLAVNASIWWDIPVPPGVVPISGGSDLFRENTVSYFGLGLAVKYRR